MHEASVIPEDIKALTGVRFFAALWVVLYHFREGLKPIAILDPLMPVINDGYLAVPMFFILSGFILSHTYFPHYTLKSHPEFVYRRFVRLWPVHVASLIALMVYIGVMVAHSGHFEDDGHTFSMAHVPGELIMVRSWFSKDLVWNYPAWSIHAEWFAYLFLFPVACLMFRTIQQRWILLLIASALLAGQTFLPIAQLPGMCAEVFFLFLTGSALYRLRILLPDFPGSWLVTVGLLLFAVAVSRHFEQSISLIYLAFGLLIFGLSYENGWVSRLLSKRPVVYGGVISYSMYMTHAVVLKFTDAAFHKIGIQTQGAWITGALLFIGSALLTASACYHLIEAPCNVALRRKSPFGPVWMVRSESPLLVSRTEVQ